MGEQLQFLVRADHYQFYLEDQGLQPDTSRLWNEQSSGDRLDVLPGLIAVSTGRYGGDIPVTVEITSTRPTDLSLNEWDHVVECSMVVQSGQLTLSSPDDPGRERFKIHPGTYRALVITLYSGRTQLYLLAFSSVNHAHLE